MALSLLQARCFDEVVRQSSFRGAGDFLGLSQPSVSAHVANLERSLGVVLFERSTRGARLTPDGERLLPVVRRLLVAEESLIDEGAALRGENRSRVRIASVRAGITNSLPEALSSFSREMPDAVVEIKQFRAEEVLEAIRSGSHHLGLIAHPDQRPDGVTGIEADLLGASPMGVCAPIGDPIITGNSEVSTEALDGRTLILMAPGTGIRTLTDRFLGRAARSPACTVGDADAAVSLVGAGVGVAVISEARAIASSPKVGWKPLRGCGIVGLSVIWAAGGPHPHAPTRLLDLLRQRRMPDLRFDG